MFRENLRYHIIESIKLLASDGIVQLSFYPDFVCKGDEIANALGDWLVLYKENGIMRDSDVFSIDEFIQIVNLDKEISMLSPEEFSDYAILNSNNWQCIRDKAKNILNMLNIEYSMPDKASI